MDGYPQGVDPQHQGAIDRDAFLHFWHLRVKEAMMSDISLKANKEALHAGHL